MWTYIPGEIYVRTMSDNHLARDICHFQGGHAHMQSELLAMELSNGRGSQSGIPWGFPPPAPPRQPKPVFAQVSCSNSDCMCAWPP